MVVLLSREVKDSPLLLVTLGGRLSPGRWSRYALPDWPPADEVSQLTLKRLR